ncbi:MAG: exodeoxyribonuclease V subunit alpha [Gammaproteobacteria bacterium]|nr:exodeoxyribonuclease V subunit alpha [Gammaproteobacteria bacterium]
MTTELDAAVGRGELHPLSGRFAKLVDRLGGEVSGVTLAAALVSQAERDGHLCLDLAVAGESSASPGLASLMTPPPIKRWLKQLNDSPLVGPPESRSLLVLDPWNRLHLRRYWVAQIRLVEGLLRRCEEAAPTGVTNPEVDSRGSLTPEQAEAVRSALSQRLTLVTGGPGTGKTTTAGYIVRGFQAVGGSGRPQRILLTAPTGQAAARLERVLSATDSGANGGSEESQIRVKALTLHRLLGASRSGHDFRHGRDNPVVADLVIVDEASMIDVVLMARLVEALPADCRLVLMGDAAQLSSVGAGSVFGDLCQSEPGSRLGRQVHRLTASHRFDSRGGLSSLAGDILDGQPEPLITRLSGRRYPGVEWVNRPAKADQERIVELALQGYQRYIDAAASLQSVERLHKLLLQFRLIGAIRRGPVGIDWLNGAIEQRIREAVGGGYWYHGQAVIVQQNDYRLGLFNGDIGIVEASSAPGGGFEVWFAGATSGELRVPVEQLPKQAPAWAVTVHGAQGSEFESVALVVPDDPPKALSRALFYTGVTRARSSFTLYGSEQAIRTACGQLAGRNSSIQDLAAASVGGLDSGQTMQP